MNLELYHRQACPFSAKVRDYILENDLEDVVTYYDVGEDEGRASELEAMTDDTQVPCLVIDGDPLLESDEIIAWFEKHQKELQ